MGRVNEDKWLDDVLTEAIGAKGTQPDFDRWKTAFPEAVDTLTSRAQSSSAARTISIRSMLIKLAVAAGIVITATIGITQLGSNNRATPELRPVATFTGPTTHTFEDGSVVKLAAGAGIRTYAESNKRGFEHLAGEIDVTVAKGLGEFIVASPHGAVKALGTQFKMELVDAKADTGETVQLLAVKVTEGKVELSNARGTQQLAAAQDGIIEADGAPYDFNQDQNVPARLRERIQAMLDAFEAGDPAAWAANFNINYLYKLIKGQVPYDPNLFGGTEEDAKRLQTMLAGIESTEQLAEQFKGAVNIPEPIKIYVRSVEVSQNGKHAQAECVRRKGPRTVMLTRPQWHHFDNDWWQIDD